MDLSSHGVQMGKIRPDCGSVQITEWDLGQGSHGLHLGQGSHDDDGLVQAMDWHNMGLCNRDWELGLRSHVDQR